MKSCAMPRKQYLEYIGYFNKKDFDGVTSCFTPDVTVEYYDNATGPQESARTPTIRQAPLSPKASMTFCDKQ